MDKNEVKINSLNLSSSKSEDAINFIDSDVKECIKRDPKGLYKKALAGEI